MEKHNDERHHTTHNTRSHDNNCNGGTCRAEQSEMHNATKGHYHNNPALHPSHTPSHPNHDHEATSWTDYERRNTDHSPKHTNGHNKERHDAKPSTTHAATTSHDRDDSTSDGTSTRDRRPSHKRTDHRRRRTTRR